MARKKMSKAARLKISRAQRLRWKKIRTLKLLERDQARQRAPFTPAAPAKKRTKKKIKVTGVGFFESALKELEPRIHAAVEKALKEETEWKPKPLWTTGTGQQIRIDEMDEGHLRNTISFLQRRIVSQFGKVTWLSEMRDMLASMVAMLDEAKKRGIRV
jgi:predicted component of type VI protein secretion system